MRWAFFGGTAFAVIAAISSEPAHSYDMPYDPYPWCAFYSGDGGGGTNCGFLTLEQCRAYRKRHRWLLWAKSILQSAATGLAFTQALGAGHAHLRWDRTACSEFIVGEIPCVLLRFLVPVFILPATLAPAWPRGIHFLMTRIHGARFTVAAAAARRTAASSPGSNAWQR